MFKKSFGVFVFEARKFYLVECAAEESRLVVFFAEEFVKQTDFGAAEQNFNCGVVVKDCCYKLVEFDLFEKLDFIEGEDEGFVFFFELFVCGCEEEFLFLFLGKEEFEGDVFIGEVDAGKFLEDFFVPGWT